MYREGVSCRLLPEAAGESEEDADAVEQRHRVSEVEGAEAHQQHLFHVGSDAQGEGRGDLVGDEAADVEGEREDAGEQHHLRRWTHRKLLMVG